MIGIDDLYFGFGPGKSPITVALMGRRVHYVAGDVVIGDVGAVEHALADGIVNVGIANDELKIAALLDGHERELRVARSLAWVRNAPFAMKVEGERIVLAERRLSWRRIGVAGVERRDRGPHGIHFVQHVD